MLSQTVMKFANNVKPLRPFLAVSTKVGLYIYIELGFSYKAEKYDVIF
jgi:hypothetical protein